MSGTDDKLINDERKPEEPARIAKPAATSGYPALSLRGLGAPTPSPAPAPGSTENLEAEGMKSHLAPRPIASPSGATAQKIGDEAELARKERTGSGVSQIQHGSPAGGIGIAKPHPIIGGILRGLDIAGSVIAPGVMQNIPGTTLHHDLETARSRGAIAQDTNEEEKEAQTGKNQADTTEAEARAHLAEEQAKVAGNPKEGLTPEETTIHDLMTGENGQPRLNPQTGNPYSYLEAYQAVNQAKQDTKAPPKQNDFEQFYADWLKDNSFPDTAHNRLLARKQFAAAGQAPQHEPRQMVVAPDGTVVEVKPGMKVPQGAKTISGDLAGAKPNAEELKRSEMAENMEENLAKLEDIVKRRPELFGPIAGRMTQGKMWLGSDDPDVGALNTIKDQIGMAQQSAHSMRSAQHVEAAAASILNGFKNGPGAINSSIKTARDSLKTFTKDVQQGNPSTRKEGGFTVPAGAPPAPKEDGHTLKANGKPIAVSKGGQWVAPE